MLVVSYQKLKLNSLHDIVKNTDLVYYVDCTFIKMIYCKTHHSLDCKSKKVQNTF